MTTPPHISALLGKRVRVSSPNDSSRWEGLLISYAPDPSIVLQEGAPFLGSRVCLPASYEITELPPQEWGLCPTCCGQGRVLVQRQAED